MVVSIKNEDSSLNHLPQIQAFASMRSTPFMEIDDKVGEIEKKILQLGFWTWTMDKEGVTLKKVKGSKFLDKRSTQVEGASS